MRQSRIIILAGAIGATAILASVLMLYSSTFSTSAVQPPAQSPNQVNDNSTTQSLENQDESVQRKEVTISLLMDYKPSWNVLLEGAEKDVEKMHPDIDVKVNPIVVKYENLRNQTAMAISNQSAIDLVALDQIWLGEFVEKGFLSDLSSKAASWGRSADWYQANWDGGVYQGKVYGVWAWTDIRGIWYWKDLLDQAGVDPNSLKTWDGYIASALKLDSALNDQGIQGVHLVGADYSPDMWYPYLWMQGGNIL